MMRNFFLFLILFFAFGLTFSQDLDSIQLDTNILKVDTNLVNYEVIFEDSIIALNEQNKVFSKSRKAYNQGLALFKSNNFVEAKEFFTNAINLDSNFVEAWHYRGKSLAELDSNILAETNFINSFRLDSSNFEPIYDLAKIQAINRRDLAINTYNFIIDSSNEEFKAYYEIGVLFYLENDIQQAINSFTSSISLKKDARTFNDRASCYRVLGDNELAIKDYITAIALNSELPFIYNNLASTYRKIGDTTKALSYYTLALSKDSNYVLAYNNRGGLYIDENNIEAALYDINKAISIDANYSPAYNNKGVIYHQKKKYEEALSYFNQAILLNSNYAKALLNRGITKQMLRDEDGACNDWIKAKELGINVANKYLVNDCN